MRIRFSANTGFLWPELSFIDRIFKAADTGFEGLEFHDEAQRYDLSSVRHAVIQTGLPVIGLNTRMGETLGCAAIPGAEEQALSDFNDALRVADALDVQNIHVLAGTADTPDRFDVLARNITRFSKMTHRNILLEPLSRDDYTYSRLSEAAAIIKNTQISNLRLLFDTFHVRSKEEDLLGTYCSHSEQIGHVQISSWPDRGMPGPDDLSLTSLLSEIRTEWVGCEFNDPTSSARPPELFISSKG